MFAKDQLNLLSGRTGDVRELIRVPKNDDALCAVEKWESGCDITLGCLVDDDEV